jgi:hypothetical protein
MVRGVAAWGASLLLLGSACSGEDSDSLGSGRDSGTSLGEGDATVSPGDDAGTLSDGAVSDAGSDPTLDGSAGDAATPELDGAVPPPRTDLTLSVESASLARCATGAVDVTWQGEPSLPAISVTGLPVGVTYSVSAQGDRAARIALRADNRVPLGTEHQVTVTVGAGEHALSAQAELTIPSTFRVTVKVLDRTGAPRAEAAVTVNGDLESAAKRTNASGELVLEDMSAPYALFVNPGDDASIEYQGLTRCDPTLVGVGSEVGASATLSGTLTAPAGESFDVGGGQFYIGGRGVGPASITAPSGATTSTFSFAPRWTGSTGFPGPIQAVWVRPGPVYVAAGSLEVSATHGAVLTGLTIPLSTSAIATREHTVRVSPGAYSDFTQINLLSFDLGAGRIDALHPGDIFEPGTLVSQPDQSVLVTTTLPEGDSVLAAASRISGGSSTGLDALAVAPAAAGIQTELAFPATAPFSDLLPAFFDTQNDVVTFSWGAIDGADAIVVDFGGSVRAVLPGDATSYSTATVFTRGTPPSTCLGTFHISAVDLDGYGPDADADGSALGVPREFSEFGSGAGRLLGQRDARVYSWWFNDCF